MVKVFDNVTSREAIMVNPSFVWHFHRLNCPTKLHFPDNYNFPICVPWMLFNHPWWKYFWNRLYSYPAFLDRSYKKEHFLRCLWLQVWECLVKKDLNKNLQLSQTTRNPGLDSSRDYEYMSSVAPGWPSSRGHKMGATAPHLKTSRDQICG